MQNLDHGKRCLQDIPRRLINCEMIPPMPAAKNCVQGLRALGSS